MSSSTEIRHDGKSPPPGSDVCAFAHSPSLVCWIHRPHALFQVFVDSPGGLLELEIMQTGWNCSILPGASSGEAWLRMLLGQTDARTHDDCDCIQHHNHNIRKNNKHTKHRITKASRLSSAQLWMVHLEFLKSLCLRFSGCVKRTGNPLTRGQRPMMPPVCWSWKPSQRRRLASSASFSSASCNQHIRFEQCAHYF